MQESIHHPSIHSSFIHVSTRHLSIHGSIHSSIHHPSIHPTIHHPFMYPPIIYPFMHPSSIHVFTIIYPFIHSCMHASIHSCVHTCVHLPSSFTSHGMNTYCVPGWCQPRATLGTWIELSLGETDSPVEKTFMPHPQVRQHEDHGYEDRVWKSGE